MLDLSCLNTYLAAPLLGYGAGLLTAAALAAGVWLVDHLRGR